LSISDVARLLLESGAQHPRLEHLAEIALLREQPTKALLRMRRKWEGDQEFSRSGWELLARYAEKGCEQHGFSSDRELNLREGFKLRTDQDDSPGCRGTERPGGIVLYPVDATVPYGEGTMNLIDSEVRAPRFLAHQSLRR
jgi:hypothetical protein